MAATAAATAEPCQGGLVVGRHLHAGGAILPFPTELLAAEKPWEEEENLEEIFAKPEIEKEEEEKENIWGLIG